MIEAIKGAFVHEEELVRLAQDVARGLEGGERVALMGDLGAGKTTFARGLIQAFLPNVRVQSPTFAILQEYRVSHPSIPVIVHIDAYRFEHAEELVALELEDYPAGVVILIEWPERIEGAFAFTHEVRIEHEGDGRRVTITEL